MTGAETEHVSNLTVLDRLAIIARFILTRYVGPLELERQLLELCPPHTSSNQSAAAMYRLLEVDDLLAETSMRCLSGR